MEAILKKQELVKYKIEFYKGKKIIHTVNETLDSIELFRTFKKYDRNMRGFLDFSEYT
jgi:hypothetical protein